MNTDYLRLCIVDDNAAFREGLRFLINAQTQWKITQEYSSGEDFYKGVIKNDIPHIILMDYHMPGIDGISVTKKFHLKFPKVNVIAVSMHRNKLFLDELIKSGFKGCVLKQNIYEQLIPTIKHVHEGGYFFNEECELSKQIN